MQKRRIAFGLRARPLSLTLFSSSPAHFELEPETLPPCQGLSLWERWHGVSNDGEGEAANNFGEYVFSYTGLDYEDLCRRNDYCIHSNYSSSFNEKIEIIF